MNLQGVLILNLIALALVLVVLDQVRRDRLYVGHGVLLVLSLVGVVAIISTPPLLMGFTHLVGAVYPASALALLAFCFIAFMLIYILTQLTLLSKRLTRVVQELALERANNERLMYSSSAGSDERTGQTGAMSD